MEAEELSYILLQLFSKRRVEADSISATNRFLREVGVGFVDPKQWINKEKIKEKADALFKSKKKLLCWMSEEERKELLEKL